MTANPYKVRGVQQVDLVWSGFDGAVHVFCDGVRVTTSALSGTSFTDALNQRGGGAYRYQVCSATHQNVCSAEVTANF